jgi:periplasmic protein TonB
MLATNENRFIIPAWGFSLAVHATAVWLAIIFAAQVKPVLQEEVFKWDVALVEPAEVQTLNERAEPVATPSKPQTRVSPAPPVKSLAETMHRVAPQQTVQMVHPFIEPVKPIEQKVEPPPVEQKLEAPQPKIEPIEEKVVEVARPKLEPTVEPKEPEPVKQVEPLVAQSQPVAAAPSVEPVESRPLQNETPPISATSSLEQTPAQNTVNNPPATAEVPVEVAKDAAPVSEAKATAQPQAKTDHRWIAESLARRLAELKRYPNEARVNRLEGKVILKAVIRSDGHLADVSVQKSSGHSILDEAAMEAVKQACPLHMKHDIGRPLIVVNVPMVYSLTN